MGIEGVPPGEDKKEKDVLYKNVLGNLEKMNFDEGDKVVIDKLSSLWGLLREKRSSVEEGEGSGRDAIADFREILSSELENKDLDFSARLHLEELGAKIDYHESAAGQRVDESSYGDTMMYIEHTVLDMVRSSAEEWRE